MKSSGRGVSGATHRTALCVVRSVGQDEGLGLQGTLAVNRAEGRVPTAGQDHEEMCRNGSLISAKQDIKGFTNPKLMWKWSKQTRLTLKNSAHLLRQNSVAVV